MQALRCAIDDGSVTKLTYTTCKEYGLSNDRAIHYALRTLAQEGLAAKRGRTYYALGPLNTKAA